MKSPKPIKDPEMTDVDIIITEQIHKLMDLADKYRVPLAVRHLQTSQKTSHIYVEAGNFVTPNPKFIKTAFLYDCACGFHMMFRDSEPNTN